MVMAVSDEVRALEPQFVEKGAISVETNEVFDAGKNGTVIDQHDMERLGKQQELNVRIPLQSKTLKQWLNRD